jgi:curli biogenesis system outer membrane secretion channel CsgG
VKHIIAMKRTFFRNFCLGLLSVALLPAAASAQEGKATLAVSSIKPTPSLAASVKPDKKLEMGRIIESLDSQLVDRINATRKFDVVGRSDLNDILKEQDLGASGNVDAKTAAQAGKLTGAKYLLVTTIDDYQDYVEKATFEGTGRSATKRVFRLSVVGKVYDSSTGKLLESANFQTGNDEFKQIQEERSYTVKDGELSDEMMLAVSRDMAQKIANRIADVIFPAKVLLKRDKEITINRGEGGGVAVGDTFNVYALGEELIDPDTKESLGRDEVKVGKVKITQVNPKTSTAEILDDTGIDKGAILRKSP